MTNPPKQDTTSGSDELRTIFNKHEVGYTIELLSDLSALINAAVAEARIEEAEIIKMEYYEYLPPHAKINFDRYLAALRTTGNGQAGQKEKE